MAERQAAFITRRWASPDVCGPDRERLSLCPRTLPAYPTWGRYSDAFPARPPAFGAVATSERAGEL